MDNGSKEKDLIKLSVAAKILGVTVDTLRRWDKDGSFNVTRTPGGHRLVSMDEVERIIDGRDEYKPSGKFVYFRTDMDTVGDFSELHAFERGMIQYMILEQARSENNLLSPFSLSEDNPRRKTLMGNYKTFTWTELVNGLIEKGYIRKAPDGVNFEVTPKDWFSFTKPEDSE